MQSRGTDGMESKGRRSSRREAEAWRKSAPHQDTASSKSTGRGASQKAFPKGSHRGRDIRARWRHSKDHFRKSRDLAARGSKMNEDRQCLDSGMEWVWDCTTARSIRARFPELEFELLSRKQDATEASVRGEQRDSIWTLERSVRLAQLPWDTAERVYGDSYLSGGKECAGSSRDGE